MSRVSVCIAVLGLAILGCGGRQAAAPEPETSATGLAEPAAKAPSEPPPPASEAVAAKKLFMDEHDMGPGKVTAEDVADAHAKDVAVQGKYGVEYKAYWVDEKAGKIYCLAEAPSAEAASTVHREAHGLVADKIMQVRTDSLSWKPTPGMKLFMDVHHMGAGKVTPEALAAAHAKDLAVQDKYGVHYLNYWLDMDTGTVMCLSEAPNAEAAVNVHKEAHGLIPDEIGEVKQGQ